MPPMPPDPAHVRNERATRRRLPQYEGRDLPANVASAWCGVLADGQWSFLGADHLINTLAAGTSITPCPRCIRALWNILDKEMNDAT